jgi:DNA-binding FadR family transcriptional regulator
MFEPIGPRESAVDACARELRRAILGGELRAGEKLPPERKLAASFGVNRMTLRNALGQLARARLVEVRQGSGYSVRDFRSEGGPELLPGLGELAEAPSERAAIVEDLLQVRRHLARALLEKLSAIEPDLGPVREAIEAFAVVTESGGDADAVAEADLAVVRSLLAATQSPVMQLCTNPVERAVRQMPFLREVIYADPQSNSIGWRALLGWLESGDRTEMGIEGIVAILRERDEATLARLRKPRRTRTKTSKKRGTK